MATHSRIIASGTPWTVGKGKKIWLEYEPPRSEGVQYATREEQRSTTNSSRKTEVARQKRKQCPIVDLSSGENKSDTVKSDVA